MDLEPDRIRALVAALGGAAIYGFVQLGATVLSGHTPTRAEYRALVLNVFCAFGAGAILAYFLVSTVAPLIPFAPLQDASAFGFAVGAFGWELAPLLFKVVRNRARHEVEQIGEAK